ncbi:MAG TPA: type II toxin-antitoxin system HicB family antitoxin [Anaerolineales bacterium]|nr:type II toxin-antitoxin system HicB family antitoxin [Anaerolineales bacterium]HNQ94554.1 type II toxin-antitoxin system HicB family antitoxin [Anaerolineales bacterium]HNS62232.1 type II toxin-antitoxin system HicB family antitoxin [Anaerolineales bacterium]
MNLTIQYEQEEDGRWLAEVKELPSTLAYGNDAESAIARVQALALRVVADQVENGQAISAIIFMYSPPIKSDDDAWERLLKLRDELGKGWQSEKSAVEILSEMRR